MIISLRFDLFYKFTFGQLSCCSAILLSLYQMSTNAIAFLALTEELVKITQGDTYVHAHMDILALNARVSNEMRYADQLVKDGVDTLANMIVCVHGHELIWAASTPDEFALVQLI